MQNLTSLIGVCVCVLCVCDLVFIIYQTITSGDRDLSKVA